MDGCTVKVMNFTLFMSMWLTERWVVEVKAGVIRKAPPKLRHLLQGTGNRVDASAAQVHFEADGAATGTLGYVRNQSIMVNA